MVEQAQKNQNSPVDFFKEVTKGRSPEQMESFYKQIEQMGFSPDVINKIRY